MRELFSSQNEYAACWKYCMHQTVQFMALYRKYYAHKFFLDELRRYSAHNLVSVKRLIKDCALHKSILVCLEAINP